MSTLLIAQNRVLHLKTYEDGDLSIWYKVRMEIVSQTELDSIQNTKHRWYFRFWTPNQAIDLWEETTGNIRGKLTSWTKEHVDRTEEEPTNRIFYENKALDSIQIRQLIALIDSTQIKTIPDEDDIKNWSQGFDGITYIVETANSKDYFFKTYWTPKSQGSLREAKVVQTFAERSLTIANASETWVAFSKKIPFECYINDGPAIACKISTRSEQRKYRRERKQYRKQKMNSP
jgi:hypothetical protein